MPFSPAMEAMFTMAPPPLASMAGIWNFIPRKVPRMLVAMPRSNSSGIDVRERRRHRPRAGVVERRIQSAEREQGRLEQATHRVGVGDVRADGERPAAARLDAVGDGFQRTGIAGGEDYGGSGGGERLAVAAPMPLLAPATSATRPLIGSCWPWY